MSLRYLAGFITASYNPLKVPNAPTIGTATAGSAQATITFTAPSNVGGGAITSYIAVATKTSDGTAVSATGSASPITITGLTDGSAYTIQVAAVNTYGPGPYSAPSGSVTPVSPKLYSWGENNTGQLGQNDLVFRSSPVQVGALGNWSAVAGGTDYVISIKTDGTLWSWGSNGQGQLGQNDTVYRSSPVQVGALTTWSKISCGLYSNLAVKTDGTLWTWGYNNNGQLGLNDRVNRSSPVQIGALTTWLYIASGYAHSLATKTDGTIWSWGRNNYGQLGQNIASTINRSSPVQIGVLTNWSKIDSSANGNHNVSIKTDGTFWSWGYNLNGQLGDNTTYNRSSPVQVGALTTWATPTAGGRFSLAVKTDGTLWAWGNGDSGELAQNDRLQKVSPVQVGALTTWSQPVAGWAFSAAIKTDGTLWTWGANNKGQLGQNNRVYRSSPVQVGVATTWVSLGCTDYSLLATSS